MRFYRKGNIHTQANRQMGQGDLSVVVTTASGAIALLEAAVSVSKDGVLFYHTLTDDAMTPVLSITVPQMELSTAMAVPRVDIEVRVYMQGYRTVTRTVTVYAERNTYLQVDMQPLTEVQCINAEGGSAFGG